MTKPTYLPEWASDPSAVRTRPNINRREFGYSVGDKPSSDNWNWQLNNIYEWIEHFDTAGILPYYTATSQIEALDGADLSNNSFYLVQDYGIYRYDDSSTAPIDDTYILEPNDSIGRFILFLAYPSVQDERTKDELGDIAKMTFSDFTSLTPRVGVSNGIIPASFNYPLFSRMNWVGDINSFSASNSNGGSFYGMCGSFTAPAATATNIHLVQYRGMGLDEASKLVLTGSRFTIQSTETFSSTATGSRFAWFTNDNATGTAGSSATALLLEANRQLTTYGTIKPSVTNTTDIGTAALVYSNIYLQNAPVVVSDERIKKDINQIDINKSFALFDKLTEKNAYIQFRFKDTEYQEEIYKTIEDENGQYIDIVDRIENKTVKGNRFHFGLSAQKLVNSMLEVGINTSDCSIIHIENYKQGDELKVYDESTGRLTVAYSEFVPLLIQTIDNLNKRVIELENFIGELE